MTRSPRSRTSATSTVAGSSSGPTSTSRSRTARSPTTCASAPRCRPSSGCSTQGAHVTACTHLGRPKGAPDPKYSVEPVRARLAELAPGVELLENLRFDPGETANDPAFVQSSIAGQDVYVNDAFGASHRAHASIVGPPQFLPSAAGRLLRARGRGAAAAAQRARAARSWSSSAARRSSDKLGVIDALSDGRRLADHRRRHVLHVPGGAGPPDRLVAARGGPGRDLRAACSTRDVAIHLPTDITGARPGRQDRRPRRPGARCASSARDLPDGWMGLDIGPGTAAEFTDVILDARTVLWNGPMGVFEDPRFEAGTRVVAEAVAETGASPSSAAATAPRPSSSSASPTEIDHVSTGGGASLELLEQGDLPGLEALRGAPNAS